MARTRGHVPTKAMEDVSLQVMVPPAIRDQLRQLAAREGRTQRSVVLDALKRIGIDVPEAELLDKRKPG